MSNVVDLLGELIAVPSVNPRLAASSDPVGGEERLSAWLAEFFSRAGWTWARQEVHPGRANVMALIPGDRGDTLLWDAHQDTVSALGMSIEPFTAICRDGRVYGRGACDVKGGMAAMLAALERLESEPIASRAHVLFVATVNEECGFTGARALAQIWQSKRQDNDAPATVDAAGGLTVERLRDLRPTAALVAEPTGLRVVVAHRGVVRWRTAVHGRAVHSSQPEQGANAIYAMTDVVKLIEEFHRVELAARPADPLCGRPTACVTTIHGGAGANTIPDYAVIDVDRRLSPDEDPEQAYQELCNLLDGRASLGDCRLEHAPPWMFSRGLAHRDNRHWAELVATIARAAGASGEIVGVPYGANAASIAAADIPTVVFGPGSIEQAHTADEWIEVAELERAVNALCAIVRTGGLT